MRITISTILAALFLISATSQADIAYTINATLDANTYSLGGTINVVLSGESLPPSGDVAFFNVRVADGMLLSTAGLTVNGAPAQAQAGGGMIGFVVPDSAANSLSVDLAFSMETLPDNEGISLLDDNLRDGVWSSWYPRFLPSMPQPADYRVDINISGPGMLAHAGDVSEVEGGTENRHYTFTQSRAWSAAVVYSPIFIERRATVDGCDLGIFVREGSDAWAARLLNFASEAYEYYIEEYAGLGLERLDIVLGAAEYIPGIFQPRIAIIRDETDRMLEEYGGVFTANYLRWQAAVNVAEAIVGSRVVQQPDGIAWLREGLSLYLTEQYSGAALLGGPVFDNIRQYYLNAATSGKNTSLSQSASEAEAAGLDPYQTLARSKGMWVVGLLAGKLERQGFRRFVEALADHEGPPLGNEDIRSMAQRFGDVDLASFFDAWVDGAAYVDYSIEDVRNNGGHTSVLVGNKGTVATPVPVTVTFDTGESETRRIELAGGAQWLNFDGAGKALRVRIDPDMKLPDIDRSNNLRSFGGSERIESLYAIDTFFDIGDILLVQQPGPEGQNREGEFELTVTNRQEQTAYLGVELIASFPGGRNRGVTWLFIELAPRETRTFRSQIMFPGRGEGLANVQARYFPVAGQEAYEQLNRASEPSLVDYYVFDILP